MGILIQNRVQKKNCGIHGQMLRFKETLYILALIYIEIT